MGLLLLGLRFRIALGLLLLLVRLHRQLRVFLIAHRIGSRTLLDTALMDAVSSRADGKGKSDCRNSQLLIQPFAVEDIHQLVTHALEHMAVIEFRLGLQVMNHHLHAFRLQLLIAPIDEAVPDHLPAQGWI